MVPVGFAPANRHALNHVTTGVVDSLLGRSWEFVVDSVGIKDAEGGLFGSTCRLAIGINFCQRIDGVVFNVDVAVWS